MRGRQRTISGALNTPLTMPCESSSFVNKDSTCTMNSASNYAKLNATRRDLNELLNILKDRGRVIAADAK